MCPRHVLVELNEHSCMEPECGVPAELVCQECGSTFCRTHGKKHEEEYPA